MVMQLVERSTSTTITVELEMWLLIIFPKTGITSIRIISSLDGFHPTHIVSKAACICNQWEQENTSAHNICAKKIAAAAPTTPESSATGTATRVFFTSTEPKYSATV